MAEGAAQSVDRAARASAQPFAWHFNPAVWADQGRRIIPMMRAYGGLSLRQQDVSLPRTLGRIGSLEVRLAANAAEVRRAQKLRWRVFYEEMRAIADAPSKLARRDIDPFDAICDHLVVIDHAVMEKPAFGMPRPAIVGTYRLLRQEVADRHGGFYTTGEFAIEGLLSRHRGLRFLELGRSCVLPAYRNKRTVELLWHGIWTYVLSHRIDVMFGCASLEGTDPKTLSLELSFLHHNARAPAEWSAGPVPARHVEMGRLSRDAIDMKKALHALPPLIKGYLRLGAHVGDGAVVDHQFGTTDVLIVLPVSSINPRYIGHFGASAERHAA
ncbi:GNAT family N-acetyltransferase [Phreatobacter sp.]|uniref:GNAT family N-acetyltransferase n=1 Tax=Phreatobacter sp. TaxID=1966341 RepID=UPI003F6E6A01